MICSDCGGETRYYDRTKRIVRYGGGKAEWVFVNRYRCLCCGRIHRALPSYILPYKHYSSEIIAGVLDGFITCETLGYEDYPCEMTMRRWLNA